MDRIVFFTYFFIYFFYCTSYAQYTHCSEEDDIWDNQIPYTAPFTPTCTSLFRANVENGCSPTATNYFTAGNPLYHPNPSSSWILANTSAGQASQTQSHEMYVQPFTYPLSVEFTWHSSLSSPCGSDDHVVLAAQVSFEGETCNSDNLCQDCNGNINFCSVGSIESGCTQDHSFYAVIAGGFGGNGLPYNSCGFVIEKAQQYYEDGIWKRRVILFPSTYISYPLQDNVWYKMKLEKLNNNLFYSIFQNGVLLFTSSFLPIEEGFILEDTHTAGIYGYWIREGVHVDFLHFTGGL